MSALQQSAAYRRAVAAAALLSSDKDGDVLAAARGLSRLLGRQGLDPATVIKEGLLRVSAGDLSRRRDTPEPVYPGEWRRRAQMARCCPDLTDWEREFLSSIVEQRSLSDRQRDKLQSILRKVGGA